MLLASEMQDAAEAAVHLPTEIKSVGNANGVGCQLGESLSTSVGLLLYEHIIPRLGNDVGLTLYVGAQLLLLCFKFSKSSYVGHGVSTVLGEEQLSEKIDQRLLNPLLALDKEKDKEEQI